MAGYHYIVVGGGSAGSVLAARLSSDPAVRVLLLEAGPADRNPFIHMPKGIPKGDVPSHLVLRLHDTARGGQQPDARTLGPRRTLGGSSAINGMVYNRGQPADFDAIAALAGEEWGWQHIGRAYKAIENHQLGAAETRGDSGPLHVTLNPASPWGDAVIAAGAAIGVPAKRDVNEPDNGEAIGYTPTNIWKGRRQSAAVAFLRPARKRRNLTVITDVRVDRVVFEGTRAVGVAGQHRGADQVWRAEREVILSAGAIQSPAILMRSGIGPADVLREAGVPMLVESPDVGANMREHRVLLMQYRLADDKNSSNRIYSGPRLFAMCCATTSGTTARCPRPRTTSAPGSNPAPLRTAPTSSC